MSNNILITRLLKDIQILKKDNLEQMGIYHHINEQDMRKIKCLIIGPEDTPYEYGYYFFDIQIPNEYPFKPPKVLFQTRTNNIRFNPNLYCCGKVCISILNTWSGPQWTSCQSLKSVLLSLQTLLNKNPLENEPGFNNSYTEKHENYIKVIQHENFRFSVLNFLNTKLNNNDCFKKIINMEFIKNYNKILLKLNKLQDDNIKINKFYSQVYHMEIKNSYQDINLETQQIYQKLVNINKKPGLKINAENNKKRKKKFVPNKKAKDFEVGFRCVSENNSCLYKVSLNKKNNKIWSRINS